MKNHPDPLMADLNHIRKGRGVWLTKPTEQLSAELGRLCGIGEQDDEVSAREKLVHTLTTLIARLPGDLRMAARAALALESGTEEMRYLHQRIEWLMERQRCSDRTARRRIDEAISRLAAEGWRELARPIGQRVNPDEGWYVEALHTRLALNGNAPQAVENRRIVATFSGLDEVIHRANLPLVPESSGQGPALELEVIYGGSIHRRTSSGHHFHYAIALPAPMRADEHHEYGVVMRIPEGQIMAQQYVCLPLRRHDVFHLRIQFDPADLPARIWRLDCVEPRAIDDRVVTQPLLVPNRLGEVTAEFRELRIGFGYGIQWDN